jgi:hypothetical protein
MLFTITTIRDNYYIKPEQLKQAKITQFDYQLLLLL